MLFYIIYLSFTDKLVLKKVLKPLIKTIEEHINKNIDNNLSLFLCAKAMMGIKDIISDMIYDILENI